MKLDVAIGVSGKTVFVKVLEMDESLRGKGTLYKDSKTGGSIQSAGSPALGHLLLYVRGSDKSQDNNVAAAYVEPAKLDDALSFIVAGCRAINEDPTYLPKPLVLDHISEAT